MKRYDSYKPSGISWIGEIPSHWEEKRLNSVYNCRSICNLSNESLLSIYLGKGVVPFNSESARRTNAITETTDLTKYQLVEVGDFVLNNQQAWRGSVGVSSLRGIISPAYIVLSCKGRLNHFFCNYAFQSRHMVGQYFLFSKGVGSIQRNLSWNDLKQCIFPVPPLAEQEKIVDYLTTKTSQIDAQVADREQEVQLLNELKQAEIANVVTRGLNPDVPMRPTNIPWLKELPSHWSERRSKYLFIKQNREVRECDDVVTCFRDGQVTLRKNRRTEGFTESFKEFGYQGIRTGDLVVHQMDAFAGACGISDSDGKSTPVYIVCTSASDKIHLPYFALVIRMMGLNGFIQSLYRGIRERSSNFSYDVFCNQLLPIPPIEEQRAIVEYIQKKNSAIDDMIANMKAEIEFLTEYKQRLIADAVTGQIKVD